MLTLMAMVATMGFRIGRTREVIDNAGALGLTALAFATATLAGTLAVLLVVFSLLAARAGVAPRSDARRGGGLCLLRDPALLIGVLAAGFLTGLLLPLFPGATGESLITWLLYALLLIVGIGLGGTDIRWGEIVTHPHLIALPLATMVGTLGAGAGVGFLLGMPAGTALSIASGFGWYSLSGVILTRLDGPATGAVAFISNMLRESMAMVLIPVLSRTRFPHLAIGAAAATSMDVTLPLIEKHCGPDAVPFSMASGAVLSLSVPLLVPLLYQIGR
jgi:uncharacterized membrane protein YbjE (DUF340 family)